MQANGGDFRSETVVTHRKLSKPKHKTLRKMKAEVIKTESNVTLELRSIPRSILVYRHYTKTSDLIKMARF